MFVAFQDLKAAARFTLQPNLVSGGPQVVRETSCHGLLTEAPGMVGVQQPESRTKIRPAYMASLGSFEARGGYISPEGTQSLVNKGKWLCKVHLSRSSALASIGIGPNEGSVQGTC